MSERRLLVAHCSALEALSPIASPQPPSLMVLALLKLAVRPRAGRAMNHQDPDEHQQLDRCRQSMFPSERGVR